MLRTARQRARVRLVHRPHLERRHVEALLRLRHGPLSRGPLRRGLLQLRCHLLQLQLLQLRDV